MVSVRYVQKILDAAARAGADAGDLAAAAGLERELLASPDQMVSRARYLDLWVEAMRRVRDPGFPVAVARATGLSDHDVLRFVCMTGPTLEDGLRRVERFGRLASDAARWELHVGRGAARVALVRDAADVRRHPGLGAADEYALAQVVLCGRQLTGRDWSPREVTFAHADQGGSRAARAFFRAPLRYGASGSGLVLDGALLALPLVKADPALSAFFERTARQALARAQPEDAAAQVRRVLAAALAGAVPGLGAVARQLGTSERTLRRRLLAEGTSYRALVDDTRRRLAEHHLEDGDLSLGEIAFLLGFSEPSAFHRAYRRWTGRTPRASRRVAAPVSRLAGAVSARAARAR